MVLNELGSRINGAFRRLFRETRIDEAVVDEMLKEVCKALLEADVNVKLVQGLRLSVKEKIFSNDQTATVISASTHRQKQIYKIVIDELARLVDPQVAPFRPKRGETNVIMFVGLQGSGKTTSCAKLAYHYARKGWKTGLVCADTFRAGAFDQLRQSATKARIPYFGSYSEPDPVRLVADGVGMFREEGFEIVIVDTSGRHRQEAGLIEEMKEMAVVAEPDCTILVVDGSVGQAVEGQARAFVAAVPVGGLILTKLDGGGRGGGALTAVAATHAPILFVGTGEQLGDLEPFAVRPFIERILGMGDLGALMGRLQDSLHGNSSAQEKQAAMLQRLQQGQLCLGDLRTQLEMIQSLGPISQVAQMIPGMGDLLVGDGGAILGRFVVILKSMTPAELALTDSKLFNLQPTRIDRIARGAGVPRADVEALLGQFRKFATLMRKLPGSSGGSGGRGGTGNSPRAQEEMAARMGLSPEALRQMRQSIGK